MAVARVGRAHLLRQRLHRAVQDLQTAMGYGQVTAQPQELDALAGLCDQFKLTADAAAVRQAAARQRETRRARL